MNEVWVVWMDEWDEGCGVRSGKVDTTVSYILSLLCLYHTWEFLRLLCLIL